MISIRSTNSRCFLHSIHTICCRAAGIRISLVNQFSSINPDSKDSLNDYFDRLKRVCLTSVCFSSMTDYEVNPLFPPGRERTVPLSCAG